MEGGRQKAALSPPLPHGPGRGHRALPQPGLLAYILLQTGILRPESGEAPPESDGATRLGREAAPSLSPFPPCRTIQRRRGRAAVDCPASAYLSSLRQDECLLGPAVFSAPSFLAGVPVVGGGSESWDQPGAAVGSLCPNVGFASDIPRQAHHPGWAPAPGTSCTPEVKCGGCPDQCAAWSSIPHCLLCPPCGLTPGTWASRDPLGP